MSRRSEWLIDLSTAVVERRWNACPQLLYRVLYGLPTTDVLALTTQAIQRYLPIFEAQWPSSRWPRDVIENPLNWIQQFGRALPEQPQPNSISDAKFIFSLDALLLAWSYPSDVSVLTSSCACGILEVIDATAQHSVDTEAASSDTDTQWVGGGGAAPTIRKQLPDPESPVEIARSREWQNILDELVTRSLHEYPDVESPEQLETDLAQWERHAMLLIVPEAASLFPT